MRGRLYSPRPLIASFWFQARGKESVLSPMPPGASSDCDGLNLCGPKRPEEAGLDRFGSDSPSRGLVPDPDFLVPGYLRRSEASLD